MRDTKSLHIISWNLRGFRRNKSMVVTCIRDENPDLILLQETLTPASYTPKIPGYIVYHKPKMSIQGSTHRGMIMAIKSTIPHEPALNENPKLTTEIQRIKLTTVPGSLEVINLYTSPKHNTELGNIIPNGSYIMAGDFNARNEAWGRITNQQGLHLQSEIMNHRYVLLNTTHDQTTIYNTTIDLAITSPDVFTDTIWTPINTLVSDHFAAKITFSRGPIIQKPIQVPSWNLNKASWDVFSTTLGSLPDPTENTQLTIEEEAKQLQVDLTLAANAAVPKTTFVRTSGLPQLPVARKWKRLLNTSTRHFKKYPTEKN